MMSEIWSLSALCRCCHVDGKFKSLHSPYAFQETIEIYSEMIHDTFGINIMLAPFDASYSICDDCIQQLRDAKQFKKQVLSCETKFQEYCKNELATLANDVKEEHSDIEGQCQIKVETEDTVITSRVEDLVEIKIEGPLTFDDGGHQPSKTDDDDDDGDDDDDSSNLTPVKGEIKNRTMTQAIHKRRKGERKKFVVKKKEIVCAICEGTCKNKMEFRKHLTDHEKPYKCRQCVMEYENYYFFKTHSLNCGSIETKNLNKDLQKATAFKCDICNKEYMHKTSLKKHIMWHNGTNKKYICHICGKTFNDTSNLKSHHMAVHDKMKPYKCTICANAYAAKKNLKIHYRKHTGERPYKCDLCSDSFLCSSDLNVHKKRHFLPPHDPNLKYICKTCYTPFEHKGVYLSHLRTHVRLKHLKCSICDKEFSCKYSLSRHIIAHSGVKNHRCGTCSQEFTQKTQLIRHEKRFHDANGVVFEKVKCKICGKNVSNLESHLKIHNNRPFVCEFCDKTYPERNTLTRHIKERHSGGKPFPCSLCNKKYIKKQRLKDHMLKVHQTPLVFN